MIIRKFKNNGIEQQFIPQKTVDEKADVMILVELVVSQAWDYFNSGLKK